MPRLWPYNRAEPPQSDDGFFRSDVVFSSEQYYDPFKVAPARRYWRVQAINSHIVNSMGAAELKSENENNDILTIFELSSPHLVPQWAADLQIDANCYGVLRQVEGTELQIISYVAPQSISIMLWDGVLQGYKVEPKYNGQTAHTTQPVMQRRYSGAKGEYLPHEVIHIKNGLDPNYGELLGDNKLRDIVELIRTDAELTHYTLAIVRNVASNSFILMPAAKDENSLRFEELKSVMQKLRNALTGVARGGIALLPGRVEAVNVGKNPRDLQFSDIHKDTESGIASTFNVSPILLKWRVGHEHSTYSNVKEARQDEQENLIYPLAKTIERGINDFFTRIGYTDEVQIQVPKLWSLEQLIALDEAGMFEAAEEVANALGLPYNSTQGMEALDDR